MIKILTKEQARALWIRSQKLDETEPFGAGPLATQKAVEHLGYVQIDTINVIERSHHHILFNRIPQYRREDLLAAQAKEKSVFEYWTHALSYVPMKDYRFYLGDMKKRLASPGAWLEGVKKSELDRVVRLIKKEGPLSIRDIKDDVLVDKIHPWASRKPSKRALQWGFYGGKLVISERQGMLKKYELADRHFDWEQKPKPATEKEKIAYLLDRALRSQGIVSLDSICFLAAWHKVDVQALILSRVKKGELLEVSVKGVKPPHWLAPENLNLTSELESDRTHLLSPFDPLLIQRKRLEAFFGFEHRFEAYLPKEKRVYGYFALPVLSGDKIIAAVDLKADREKGKLLMQQWTWVKGEKTKTNKSKIEAELHRFEKFQLP